MIPEIHIQFLTDCTFFYMLSIDDVGPIFLLVHRRKTNSKVLSSLEQATPRNQQ